jgi:transcriptional regulator with XRE-family HTH domain
MAADDASRQELARFLRSRRERLTPSDVGFPVGPRRRSEGLRREEVAILAGVSPTWYTYLEQGRDINPSPELLDSLARVLAMTEDERRYIHILSYGQVTDPLAPATDISGDELSRQIIEVTQESPYPVYAANKYADLVGWNRAATEWYDDWSRFPRNELNIIRWMLTEPCAKVRLLNWESDTRDAVARWRGESAKWPADDCVRRRVAELSAISSQFVAWWADHDVQEHRIRVRRFRHPKLGIQTLRIVPLQASEFAGSGIVFHVPVDMT